MKFKLISNESSSRAKGHFWETKIIDQDTGREPELPPISAMKWEINSNSQRGKLTITFDDVPADIFGEAEIDILDYSNHPIKLMGTIHETCTIEELPNKMHLVRDAGTQNPVGAVQSFCWEKSAYGNQTPTIKIEKLFFQKEIWPVDEERSKKYKETIIKYNAASSE